ncbi:hypothetical protein [Enterococcus phage EFC-1]|nr:hypothetical protein PI32_gp53 [Enterococcus phage EFC-1]AIS73990.1 hypothetical protein [Enterococcus phage EFC-1]
MLNYLIEKIVENRLAKARRFLLLEGGKYGDY